MSQLADPILPRASVGMRYGPESSRYASAAIPDMQPLEMPSRLVLHCARSLVQSGVIPAAAIVVRFRDRAENIRRCQRRKTDLLTGM